jgi:RNA polymerase sigma-70 factor, ECF subfamily
MTLTTKQSERSDLLHQAVIVDSWSNVADSESCLEHSCSAQEVSAVTAEKVFYTHARLVYKVARRMLDNEDDVEDVAQEVMLRVVRKLDSFRGESRLATWLCRVTRNTALIHRRKAIRREREINVPLAALEREAPRVYACPVQRLLDNEMRELIEGAIARLPKMYREVYVLADIGELGSAEIGEILHLGVPAVKSRLHRARLMMREALVAHRSTP